MIALFELPLRVDNDGERESSVLRIRFEYVAATKLNYGKFIYTYKEKGVDYSNVVTVILPTEELAGFVRFLEIAAYEGTYGNMLLRFDLPTTSPTEKMLVFATHGLYENHPGLTFSIEGNLVRISNRDTLRLLAGAIRQYRQLVWV